MNIYPDNTSSATSAYNTLFATKSILDFADTSLVYDNEALTRLCKNHSKILNPTYSDMNKLIAYSLSSMTCAMRKDGYLNVDLK